MLLIRILVSPANISSSEFLRQGQQIHTDMWFTSAQDLPQHLSEQTFCITTKISQNYFITRFCFQYPSIQYKCIIFHASPRKK